MKKMVLTGLFLSCFSALSFAASPAAVAVTCVCSRYALGESVSKKLKVSVEELYTTTQMERVQQCHDRSLAGILEIAPEITDEYFNCKAVTKEDL